jgi:uncharacterized protein (DUF362 family)
MKRREFFKKSIGAGLAAGAAMSIGPGNNLLAENLSMVDHDLVAVKGGEPGVMFDQAIQSLGGIEKYVKRGQSVVVKPNLGWDATPERAANTNPQLMARMVEHCLTAGARDVYVFDNTINEWTRCYKNSGIEKAVKDAGAKVLTGKSKGSYHEVAVEGGRKLKKVLVHQLILESDVFINVPVLKSHGGSVLSISMKNLMGVVWDRRWWHANDLHQCIADINHVVKPDLNVVDAYRVLKRNGPRGVSTADVVTMKSQIISEDIVAADAAAAKLFGKDPGQIGHIRKADEMGVGSMDLSGLNINRIMI